MSIFLCPFFFVCILVVQGSGVRIGKEGGSRVGAVTQSVKWRRRRRRERERLDPLSLFLSLSLCPHTTEYSRLWIYALPTSNNGVKKWKRSRNMHTLHTLFFRACRQLVMLSRCLVTKISASELRRKLIESALLAGLITCFSC